MKESLWDSALFLCTIMMYEMDNSMITTAIKVAYPSKISASEEDIFEKACKMIFILPVELEKD